MHVVFGGLRCCLKVIFAHHVGAGSYRQERALSCFFAAPRGASVVTDLAVVSFIFNTRRH